MKRSLFAQTIGLSLLLLGGCSGGNAGDQDNVQNKIKVCQSRDPDTGTCADNNGDDINNPNAAGYERIASAFFQSIKGTLEQPATVGAVAPQPTTPVAE